MGPVLVVERDVSAQHPRGAGHRDRELPACLYPTMLCEFTAAAAIAGVVWVLRAHPFRSGWLFSLYLVLSSNERFDLFGLHPTEAQFITVVLLAVGVAGLFWFTRRRA